MRHTMKAWQCFLFAVFVHSFAGAADFTFTTVSYPGANETAAYGINDHGVVVGEYGIVNTDSPISIGNSGFSFDGTNYQQILFPDSLSTAALGINNHGTVVGEYLDSNGDRRGFKFDGTNYTSVTLPTVDHETILTDINDQGDIVGASSDDDFANNNQAFSVVDDVYQNFNFPGANVTFFTGINNGGERAGTYITDAVGVGFRRSNFQQYLDLPDVMDVTTEARGVNNFGDVVGNYNTIQAGPDGLSVLVGPRGFIHKASGEFQTDVPFPTADCEYILSVLAPELPEQCLRKLTDINNSGAYVGYSDQNDGVIRGFIANPSSTATRGDFNSDGTLGQSDIDMLTSATLNGSTDSMFDLNGDQALDSGDRQHWVTELKVTHFGDANLDQVFDSSDLNQVFQSGKYGRDEDATWAQGDWSGDLRFDSVDILMAFRAGGYQQGITVAKAVPEIDATWFLAFGFATLVLVRRHCTASCFPT